MSRSKLFTKAVQQFIEVHAATDVTGRLDAVYSENSSKIEETHSKMQTRSRYSATPVRDACSDPTKALAGL